MLCPGKASIAARPDQEKVTQIIRAFSLHTCTRESQRRKGQNILKLRRASGQISFRNSPTIGRQENDLTPKNIVHLYACFYSKMSPSDRDRKRKGGRDAVDSNNNNNSAASSSNSRRRSPPPPYADHIRSPAPVHSICQNGIEERTIILRSQSNYLRRKYFLTLWFI